MTRIDKFINDFKNDETYARFVLFHKRLPAVLQESFKGIMKDFPLFCTYKGMRYRVTGASCLDGVFLAEDFTREYGYDHIVEINLCSHWSDIP